MSTEIGGEILKERGCLEDLRIAELIIYGSRPERNRLKFRGLEYSPFINNLSSYSKEYTVSLVYFWLRIATSCDCLCMS